MSPILDRETIDFISHSADQTRRMGLRLGQLFEGGEVVCLVGDLGTGKTCLVQGIGLGLGVADQITSPTFTLVSEYVGSKLILYHIDLYRVGDVQSALALGLDEYLYDDGICAIEWAGHIEEIWPDEHLLISLRHIGETKRGLTLRGVGGYYERLVRRFRQSAFGV